MNHLGRPLGCVKTWVANSPAAANGPAASAAFGWFLHRVGLGEYHADVGGKGCNASGYWSAVSNPQTVDGTGTKLIQWIGIQRILRRDRRQISCTREFDNNFSRDKIIAAIGVHRDATLTASEKANGGEEAE
jgi:hypothetical protein